MKSKNKQNCKKCGHSLWKDGRDRNGRQLWKCSRCKRRITEPLGIIKKPEIFGQHLRQIRINAKLTIKNVSKELKRSESWLSRIEKGDRSIAIDDLFRLAAIYQTRASNVLAEFEKIRYLKGAEQ